MLFQQNPQLLKTSESLPKPNGIMNEICIAADDTIICKQIMKLCTSIEICFLRFITTNVSYFKLYHVHRIVELPDCLLPDRKWLNFFLLLLLVHCFVIEMDRLLAKWDNLYSFICTLTTRTEISWYISSWLRCTTRPESLILRNWNAQDISSDQYCFKSDKTVNFQPFINS